MDFEVYTDRSQCEYFEVSYMDMEAELVIAASTLLASGLNTSRKNARPGARSWNGSVLCGLSRCGID